MATRKQGTRNLGRIWAAILAGFLAASSLMAITVLGRGTDQRTRDRLVRLRIMDMLVLDYDKSNWYAVTSNLAAHPEDPGNAAVMSVFLSIGNVHLNLYEVDGDPAHLDRALSVLRMGRREPQPLGRAGRIRLDRQLSRYQYSETPERMQRGL
jgi:hypothetical protein